jgi:histidine triad (HIT) family protein
MPTIFSKIISREIQADIVYEYDLVLAFKDINPQAPTHILIVPKKEIPSVSDVTEADEQALGRLFIAAKKIAEAQGIARSGYRLIICSVGVHWVPCCCAVINPSIFSAS